VNVETGKVYTGPEEVEAARARGERLVPVSDRAADLLRRGRAAKCDALRKKRRVEQLRKRSAMAKASRRKNRQR
jgi:hypothetical protein